MSSKKQHKITVEIADVEPFSFEIDHDQEPIFRKAVFHVNTLWEKFRARQAEKSSEFILAKVALAFTELFVRRNEQLEAQSKLLDEFERSLDDILLKMED